MTKKMPRTPFSTPLSGSARETEIRIRNIFSGPKKRPPVLFLVLMFSVCIFCGNLVSCQVKEAEAPNAGGSSSLEDLPDPPEREPEAEVWERQAVLEDIDLDGDGLPDTVTATTRFDPQSEAGTYNTLTVTAVLGSGTELEYHETEEPGWCLINVIQPDRITSPDRDSLILELEAFGSTYGAAKVLILELDGGKLTQRYCTDENSTICGSYCIVREDSPLSAVRIPVLVEKWHAPEYYTLSWNGTGWDFVGDGYFTDAWTITVTGGRVLTLALRGRYTGEQFGPHLIYDQIQVFDGDMMFNPDKLIQAIVPEDVPGDDRFPEQIFIADDPDYIHIQDINFDGSEDFAIRCDSTKSTGRRWFRWNEGQGQFEYAFSLAGTVEVVPQGQHLIEEYWDEYGEYVEYNIYGFNNRGWLILESTWNTMAEAQDACKEIF